MLREANAMVIACVSVTAPAVALNFSIPRDRPWRIPGGWPLGSGYDRMDTFALGIFFSAGIIAGFLALFGAFEWSRS